jgi:hypothetical protein
VSHAGIPFKNEEHETYTFYIPKDIGIVPNPILPSGILYTNNIDYTKQHYYDIENINILNKKFNIFIDGIKDGINISPEYIKYVAMSANTFLSFNPILFTTIFKESTEPNKFLLASRTLFLPSKKRGSQSARDTLSE